MRKLLLLLLWAAAVRPVPARDYWVYIGTHSNGPHCGISVARFSDTTGELRNLRFLREDRSPSYLAVSRDQRVLYVANSDTAGGVGAYQIDRQTGGLSALNAAETGGGDTCYVTFDRSGRYLLAANYLGGSCAVFQLGDDGRIGRRTAFEQHHGHGLDPVRQDHPYAHSVEMDASGRVAFVTDLGTDQIYAYPFDPASGALDGARAAVTTVAPGLGPRHARLHPNGRWLYVDMEMGNAVGRFDWDAASRRLTLRQSITTLSPEFHGANLTGELRIHPSGRFLYVSNRRENSLVEFALDPSSGELSFRQRQPAGGDTPRNFELDPSGRWLICDLALSHRVVVFAIDPATGQLAPRPGGLDLRLPYGVVLCPVAEP